MGKKKGNCQIPYVVAPTESSAKPDSQNQRNNKNPLIFYRIENAKKRKKKFFSSLFNSSVFLESPQEMMARKKKGIRGTKLAIKFISLPCREKKEQRRQMCVPLPKLFFDLPKKKKSLIILKSALNKKRLFFSM